MNCNFKESKYGTIIPNTINKIDGVDKWVPKQIAYLMKNNDVITGCMAVSFKTKDNDQIYGIEINKPFPFSVNKENKHYKEMKCKSEYLIFLKSTIEYIEMDDLGIVANADIQKNSKNVDDATKKYEINDIVLVNLIHFVKAARIQKSMKICGILCHEIKMTDSLNECNFTVLDKNVIGKLLDDHGFVSDLHEHLKLESDNSVVDDKIGSSFEYLKCKGKLRWKGTVNGLDCVGIENDSGDLSDFSFFTKNEGSYWSMVPFDKDLHVSRSPHQDNPPLSNSTKRENTPPGRAISHPRTDHSNIGDSTETKLTLQLKQPLCIMEEIQVTARLDKSARSIYSIVNSMFVFTEIFDSLIIDSKEEICRYISSNIVMPIRSKEAVGDKIWIELSKMIKEKKKGDEFSAFLEVIGFKIKMFPIKNSGNEDIAILDLSSANIKSNIKPKIIDMVNMYCLNNKKWILKPPKSLILGFTEARTANSNKIPISSKLDISKVTCTGKNCCSVCSTAAEFICEDCSKDKTDITYFCNDHKTHCKHQKEGITKSEDQNKVVKGKVELDLFSIVCRNKMEYHVYLKTNDVKGNWIRLSIQENGDCSKTLIDLQSYFTPNAVVNKLQAKDIENIENHMVLCIYKYSPLEFYWNGF